MDELEVTDNPTGDTFEDNLGAGHEDNFKEDLEGSTEASDSMDTDIGYHQLTAAAIADTNADSSLGLHLFVGGCVLLLLQCLTVIFVDASTSGRSSCVRNEQCSVLGMFCTDSKCEYCGTELEYTEFLGFNYTLVAESCAVPIMETTWIDPLGKPTLRSVHAQTNWCEACVTFNANEVEHVSELGALSRIRDNVAMMRKGDWLGLALCSSVVGFAVGRELDDMVACNLASTNLSKTRWHFALQVFGVLRRYFFVPATVKCIPSIVIYGGGDVTSICLNVVALLFLLEIDNYAYGFGLTDVARSRLQREIKKAKLLGSEDAKFNERHTRSKVVHAVLITVSVLVATKLRSSSTVVDARWWANTLLGMHAPFFAMMFGKWFEVVSDNSPNSKKLKSVASVALVCVVSMFVSVIAWIIAVRVSMHLVKIPRGTDAKKKKRSLSDS